jgi:sugar-specific transcriptional regulator TrmB
MVQPSKEIEHVLNELGLSAKEAKLYIYLGKSGPQKASVISRSLGIHKVEVYRYLKNLENKDFVESTLERPTRFVATPLEQVLDSLISSRRNITTVLQEQKESILRQWNVVNSERPLTPPERFVTLLGRESVYLRILRAVKQTQREVLGITTNVGLLYGEQNGILAQGITQVAKEGRAAPVNARLLTPITNVNLEVAKSLKRMLRNNRVWFDIRHLDLDTKFAPRFVISDDDEVVIFLTTKGMSTAFRNETGLWTNSNAVVSAYRALFEALWKDSKPLSERIGELQGLL